MWTISPENVNKTHTQMNTETITFTNRQTLNINYLHWLHALHFCNIFNKYKLQSAAYGVFSTS